MFVYHFFQLCEVPCDVKGIKIYYGFESFEVHVSMYMNKYIFIMDIKFWI